MTRYFEILILKTTTTGGGETTSSYSLEISPEHDDEFDEFISSHGGSGFMFMNRLSESTRATGWPWAAVAFEREYSLAGNAISSRLSSDAVTFGSFTNPVNGYPKLGFLLFRDKKSAEAHKDINPLFASCWACLKDQPESSRWFCIAEPLPIAWVTDAERTDASVFSETLKKVR